VRVTYTVTQVTINSGKVHNLFSQMSRSMKRQRTSKRPVDKALVSVALDGIGTTTSETVLYTATKACTVSSVRSMLSFVAGGGTIGTTSLVAWAIIHKRDGQQIGTAQPVLTDGANFYEPEQDVLLHGYAFVSVIAATIASQGAAGLPIVQETKTMRKLKAGDQISMIFRANATDQADVRAVNQLFIKE